MHFSKLAAALGDSALAFGAERAGAELRDAVFDSRRVRPGSMFCALPGTQSDGGLYVDDAIRAGAAAVLHAGPERGLAVPELVVAAGTSVARVGGEAAALLAGRPSSELYTAAVTGTNGKTTVVHLSSEALIANSIRTAQIGTLGFALDLQWEPGSLTTPFADEIHGFLADAARAGARAALLEASSHGLAQDRLAGLEFDVAAWTNLSHDHLDYHGNFEAYAASKARLFEQLPADGVALLPHGDDRVTAACAQVKARRITWSIDEPTAALYARCTLDGEQFVLDIVGELGPAQIASPLVGRHNAANLVLAFGIARLAGLQTHEAADALSSATAPPGRLERVAPDSPWKLFVDYAHTPDALSHALKALRETWPEARIGVVFGAGGDRDRTKRAPMGAAAATGSDWCVVTSDNPRTEEPEAIAEAVAQGVRDSGREAEVIVDRRRAIREAVERLRAGDILLVAGKGHEPYQEVNGVRHPFDDRVEVREAAECLA